MYDFYYDVMKREYHHDVHMHYTDTDSLFLTIDTNDIYEDMAKNLKMVEHFDISNYKPDHKLFEFAKKHGTYDKLLEIQKNNAGTLGKFKDEAGGGIIKELCFNKPKMYSYLKEGEDEAFKRNKKAKGVPRSVMKYIKHEMYRQSLISDKPEDLLRRANFHRIQCKSHVLATVEQEKRTLSHYDD